MESWVKRLSLMTLLMQVSCGAQNPGAHHVPAMSSLLVSAQKRKIDQLEAQLKFGRDETSKLDSARIQLEINETRERLLAIEENTPEKIKEIKSKYVVIRKILSIEAAQRSSKQEPNALKSPLSSLQSIKNPDEHYEEPFSSVYHPRVLAEVQKVFSDFGYLYISETVNSDGQFQAQELRVKRPWSGYWHPLRDRSLYEGEHAPLAKLDRVLNRQGFPSQIVAAEKKIFGIYSADGWEGLCDAWALASASSPEPSESLVIEGVEFTTSDLKALLTFSHTSYPYRQYGITYQGDADTDGTFQDLKPEAFHKVVTHILAEQKRAIVIDETPGVEIWNKPLFRYRWEVQADPDCEFAYLVKGFPWLINQRSDNSIHTTDNNDIVAPIYHYRLYVDRNVVYKGQYRVVAGQWIKNSRSHHPGNVKVPILNGPIGSHNPEFNKYLSMYKSLFL